MALAIAQLGQPVLREVARPVSPEMILDPQFQTFLDDMLETMKSSKGVGLAAPQVFASRRVFVASIMPGDRRSEKTIPEVFINPELRELSSEMEPGWEGCLSFLELSVLVPRHTSLRIDYLNREGQPQSLPLTGFPARVVQHEYDHLDGILTIDRAATPKNIIKSSEIDDAIEW
ncbi:peptide deformylase [bacterium]|jgi:peptide deformylase|nr:peptide deformylase [bacterium]